jgi:hypothetical protein
VLVEVERGAVVGTMDGTSPTFVGARVFFRRNGVGGARDEVMIAEPPAWSPRLVLDLPGEPHYPAALHLSPPAIEPWGRNLIGKFYRRVVKDGGVDTTLTTVLFDKDGKILDRRNEPL